MWAILDPRRTLRSLTPATAQVVRTARGTWAPTTATARVRLWDRFTAFHLEHPTASLDLALAKFTVAQDVLPSTALTYAKQLHATVSRFGVTAPILRLVMSGLLARGAGMPTHQAPAISRVELDSLLLQLPERFATPCLLAWKCAARWADLLPLQRHHFLVTEEKRIVVRWGTTKSTRLTPFAPTLWTVIDDDDPTRLRPILARIAALGHGEPFTTVTTAELDRELYRHRVKWTAHSLKRGAVTTLIEAAAEGLVDPWIVARLAKHKSALHEFPETTLRYAANDPATALMLGTQLATRLL